MKSLPLTISCFSKIPIGFTFPVLAHAGTSGQRAIKCVCACVRACVCQDVFTMKNRCFPHTGKNLPKRLTSGYHDILSQSVPVTVTTGQENHTNQRQIKWNKKSEVNIPALESIVRFRLFPSFVNLQKHRAIKQMCCLPTK